MMYQLVHFAPNKVTKQCIKRSVPMQKTFRLAPYILTFVLLLCSAKYVKQGFQWVRLVREWNLFFEGKQLPLLCNEGLIISYDGFTPEYFSPFELVRFPVRQVCLGWLTAIPLNEGLLESHKDFVDSDISLFCKATHPPVELVEAIHQNYEVLADLVLIDGNDEYALYQLKSIKN